MKVTATEITERKCETVWEPATLQNITTLTVTARAYGEEAAKHLAVLMHPDSAAVLTLSDGPVRKDSRKAKKAPAPATSEKRGRKPRVLSTNSPGKSTSEATKPTNKLLGETSKALNADHYLDPTPFTPEEAAKLTAQGNGEK